MLTPTASWYVHDGRVFNDTGVEARLKGISWFGFETQDMAVNGLWQHPVSFYMKKVKENGFNILRIPFCSDWVLNYFDGYPYNGMVAADPECRNKKAVEIMDMVFDKADALGIGIMLDLHRLTNQYISELWYSPTDNRFTSETFFKTWFTILDRYEGRRNLIAIDLLNEPHDRATWGSNDASTDWRLFAEYAIARIEEKYPNNTWLYFVEGVGWGKDLTKASEKPIRAPNPSAARRIVYSPHNYGASVVPSVDTDNVNGLRHDWNNLFGHLRSSGQTVIVGEWGGRTSIDSRWMTHWVEYSIENGMRNNFFWSLGPNSGDVQGFLLDDWETVDAFKAKITHAIQPDPVLPLP